MRFLNPAGLWLLLGVPLLIIIYLIRSQHEDRSVSSTFIWKLSSRFVKKRLPIQRIRKILLFLLQLILILGAAFMAAKPTFVEGNTYDYIIILDASASMQQKNENKDTRFDEAKELISDLSTTLRSGHTMTVILAGDAPTYLVKQSKSSNEIKLALGKAECTYGSCNTEEAIKMAQEMCDRTENSKVYFYTDREFEKAGNIGVINLSNNEWNVSIQGLESLKKSDHTEFVGTMVSYHKEATVSVGLKIDGKPVDVQVVKLESDTPTQVVFKREKIVSFDNAEIYIETKDAFSGDNFYALCNKYRKKHDVLIISASPFYIESALEALDNCKISVYSSLDNVELKGYDLYIFDQITPFDYPTDGSVILFGTQGLPSGIRVGYHYDIINKVLPNMKLEHSVLEGLEFNNTVVNGYSSLIGNSSWDMLLYCREVPVLATMERENGTSFTVFSFDLHDSNLPLKSSFLKLMDNLVEYSVPSMIKQTSYTAGQEVEISVLYGTEELYIKYPDENVRRLLETEKKHVIYPDQIGIYTAVMKAGEEGAYSDFFVHIPEGEMSLEAGPEINVALSNKEEKEEAYSGVWFWVALLMLLLILAEWGVYYYEQY